MRKITAKHILVFLLGALPLFAAPPVVSNISFLYGSHSSVSVVFDISATGNDFRVRYIPVAQGSCDQGNAAATVEFFGFPNLSAKSLTGLQLPISGLAANTKYEFCPEVSNDKGHTWSITGGSNPVGADFTTLPLPAIHPALPIHPATFDTSYPDTTQGTCWSTGQPGYCTVTITVNGTSCTNLSADMNAAIAHQKTSGTIIQIPAGSVCEYFGNTIYNGDSRSWTQLSPDAIAYNPSNVTNNTIALTNHGLSEGQGVMFSQQEEIPGNGYLPGVPSGVHWGYIYFVHVVDANDFQLYQNWEQETGSETSGKTSVVLSRLAGWASSPGISVGEEIVGSGIPSGTTISAIDYNAKTLTLSQAATATASGVTFNFGGPLQDIGTCRSSCTSNGRIAHFVPWPRQIPYWIIVRTSTPDSQFAPEGTRVNPSWASKMVTIEAPSSGIYSMAPYVYSTHIRFTGIEWTWIPSTELSSDPAAHKVLFGTPSDNSDIIFDRDWFHGPDGRSNRVYEMMGFNGMDVAIVNSYWDNLDYWHASYAWPRKVNKPDQPISTSQSPSGSAGRTSFTVPQTTVYYGAANPATLPNRLTVSWTGRPDSSIATPEIAVYFDMRDNLKIVAPQGLSVTASAGTVGYTTTSGSQKHSPAYAYCDEGDPMIPVDKQGHEAAAPLGCVRVNASGQIISGGISRGTVYHGIDDEGCQCLIAGVGPGPWKIANNYISGSGIVMHFDNSGYNWRGDYLIRRNTFHVPMTELNDAANGYAKHAGIPSDGYWYANRQLFESKGGERYWLDGNIFAGGFSDIDHGLPFLFQSAPGDTYGVKDVDITNNTICHNQISMGVLGHIGNGHSSAVPTFVSQRYRSYNNLIWDINGFIYSTVGAPIWGVGGFGEGSFSSASGGAGEDFIFDHNTIYDLNGMTDQFWGGGVGPIEGVQITNNIIPYGIGVGGEDLFIQAWGKLNSRACAGNPSTNEAGTNCAFVAGAGNPDMIFKGNLLIPTWQKSQYPEGGAQLPRSTIRKDWPDYYAQNTIMTQHGALNALKAVGWAGLKTDTTIKRSWDAQGNYTGTVPDFRLQSASLYSHGHTTDGKPVGADIDALEAAQGKVALVGANQITGSTAIINYVAPDSASCSVDYSSTDPTLINSFTRVHDAGGARARNVTLRGLSSHTTYHFRVNCAVQQPTGQFQTN